MHLFRCTHLRMHKKRKEIMIQFRKKGLKGKVPRHIVDAFCHVIKTECKEETTYVKRSYDPEIKEAIREQQQIGIHLMLRGFLAMGWMKAIEKAGT